VPVVTPGLDPDAMRALVQRRIHEGFNRGDWSVCETTLADDYTAYYGADGQRYAKPGTTVYRVEAGRLARSWGVEDTLGWFRQLGKYE
jgi:hypothetical protein